MVVDSIETKYCFVMIEFKKANHGVCCFKLDMCVLCLTVEAASTGASQDEADDANSPFVTDDDDR